MDIYAKVILAMAAFNALIVAAWMVHLAKTGNAELNAVKAKNVAIGDNRINLDDWYAERIATNKRKAKAIAEFQALSELNNDFNAVLEGE